MNLYFLSGLGADKRVFKNIRLPAEYRVHYIDWLKPSNKESLEHYSKRLAACIDISHEFILLGLSFGGLVAVEMNKFLSPKATILVSSVSLRKQLPFHHRQAGRLKMYQFFPYRLFKMPSFFVYWLFGAKKKEEKNLIKAILNDTDYDFLEWAIERLVTWENKIKPDNLFQIHGTYDKLFPIFHIWPDYKVKKGGHFMILNQAKEISAVLTTQLNLICS